MITETLRASAAPPVSASAEIDAPSAAVYRLIADYRTGHSRILPFEFFRNLRIEAGGYGAGTVISFDMLAYGRTRHQLAYVSEPEPGRTLVERYPASGAVTTFTVDSLDGSRSRVTIATRLPVRPGTIGLIELLLMRRYLRRVYVAELELVAREARSSRATLPSHLAVRQRA